MEVSHQTLSRSKSFWSIFSKPFMNHSESNVCGSSLISASDRFEYFYIFCVCEITHLLPSLFRENSSIVFIRWDRKTLLEVVRIPIAAFCAARAVQARAIGREFPATTRRPKRQCVNVLEDKVDRPTFKRLANAERDVACHTCILNLKFLCYWWCCVTYIDWKKGYQSTRVEHFKK